MTDRPAGTTPAALQASLAVPALVAASTVRAGLPLPSSARAPAASPSASRPPSAPRTRRPRADCTADSAGGLTFDVRMADGPGAVSEMDDAAGDAALLLRRRGGGDGPADGVRLPLGSAGTKGTLRAVLPSIMTLPEGRWDAYLVLADAEPRRLLPGVHDLRSLIDRVPRQSRTWLGVRIPYATKFGNLTVRSWLRWPHAEAGQLRVAEGSMVLHGRLYGALLSDTARLYACPRDAGAPPVSVPVPRETGGLSGEDGREGGELASDFAAELPLAALPCSHRVWDLWLRPQEGAEPVRIARILDDVPDKKQIFSYPPQRVTDAQGDRAVRPFYTPDNDLSVRVSCAEGV